MAKSVPDRFRTILSGLVSRYGRNKVYVILVVVILVVSGFAWIPTADADGDGIRNFNEWDPVGDTDWQDPDTDNDGLEDGTEIPSSQFNATNPDTDNDGLNDSQESEFGSNASLVDTDSDGLNDFNEEKYGTDPTDKDTDSDQLSDGSEVERETNPLNPTTDGDKLTDGLEVKIGSDPLNSDTDGDRLPDGVEYEIGTSLRDADTDDDTLSDFNETRLLPTNATRADTDNDGLSDPDEVFGPTKANVSDTDDDGLEDGPEYDNGTNPLVADTDNDSLSDGPEVKEYGTNPLHPDTDEDNLTDGTEVREPLLNATDPDIDDDKLNDGFEWHGPTNVTLADTDGDGLDDWNETVNLPTDPVQNDTDGDQLEDGAEVRKYGTNPVDNDTDSDGAEDGREVLTLETNATNPDTDGDSLLDGREVDNYGTDPLDTDTDNDGLPDDDEVERLPTDPTNNDTDGDGLHDQREVNVSSFSPTSPDDLHNNSSASFINDEQKVEISVMLSNLGDIARKIATDDPNAGFVTEFSQVACSLPGVPISGSTRTIAMNLKKAGMYQAISLLSDDLGYGLSATAIEGRLKQALRVGKTVAPVSAIASDYSRVRKQSCEVVNNTNVSAADKMDVVLAVAMFAVDTYLTIQTGGTFKAVSSYKIAFGATGKIAVKTGLARLAKFCSWTCVGSVERIIHWTVRTGVEFGEAALVSAALKIGHADIGGISLAETIKNFDLSEFETVITMLKEYFSESIIEYINTLTTDRLLGSRPFSPQAVRA